MPIQRAGMPGEAGQRRDRVDPERRSHGQHGRHCRDQRLGNGKADRAGQRVDIGGRTGDEVARPGPLDRRERQAEHAAHEVLPKLGEDLLRDHERGAPREPGQHRLREQEHGEDQHELVDVRLRRPVLDGLDETAEQRRSRKTRRRRRRVQADHPEERPPVPAREQPSLAREARARRRSEGARSQVLPARDRLAVVRPFVLAARGGVPSATTRPPRTRTTLSAWSSTSGLVAAITVVRPARASRSRRAILASVWASTALVGSTRTSTSASASSARARTSRCRWPPENDRPRSSTSASSPSGSASRTSSAFATEIACEDLLVVRAAPGIELGAQLPGEENRIGLADDDPSTDVAQAEILEGGLAEQHVVPAFRSVRAGPRSPSSRGAARRRCK